jgi:threonine/homoserine/homoserine lactone efflux protein
VVHSVGWGAPQVVVLGLAFTVLCLLVYGSVALSSGTSGDRHRQRPRFAYTPRRQIGSILIALGLRLFPPEGG